MGDGNPKYKDLPRPESIEFFEQRTRAHKKVITLDKIKEQQYLLTRRDSGELIYLTNLYIVGIADVHEILSKFPEVDCIVTISSWNSYSSEAKDFCISQNIALFKFSEFYGALYYFDDKFYTYKPPGRDD
jgi:hypothetical protein